MMYKQLDGRGQLNGASQLEGRMQMCDEGWLRYPEPMDNGVDAVDSEMTKKSVVKERMVNKSLVKERIVKNRTADRKSTRLNSSHVAISYAVFCLKKKKQKKQ